MAGIVLLSGGLDSTVALAIYLEKNEIDIALTFDYGQRARLREIQAASKIAAFYSLKHKVIELDFLKEQTKTSLVNTDNSLPTLESVDLDNLSGRVCETAKSVWVPNRNALFINIAAVFAENMNSSSTIITGFNREEAATFSDNSEKFLESINQSLKYSTQKEIVVGSPTIGLSKQEIMQEALRLNIPLEYLWSCYSGFEHWCGECESCMRFKRALITNGKVSLLKQFFRK